MIFYVTGMKTAGKRTKGVVELIDVFPILADLIGYTPPDNLEGESFAPLLENPSETWDNEPVMSSVGLHIRSGKNGIESCDFKQFFNFLDKY